MERLILDTEKLMDDLLDLNSPALTRSKSQTAFSSRRKSLIPELDNVPDYSDTDSPSPSPSIRSISSRRSSIYFEPEAETDDVTEAKTSQRKSIKKKKAKKSQENLNSDAKVSLIAIWRQYFKS